MFDSSTSLEDQINVLENGVPLSDAGINADQVWTGLESDGSTSSDDCGGWLATQHKGRFGGAERSNNQWIDCWFSFFILASFAFLNLTTIHY
jgi:hypothetical protein